MAVVEKIEGLRQLEGVLGDECRLLCAERRTHLRIERSSQQHQFPQIVAFGRLQQILERSLVGFRRQAARAKIRLLLGRFAENIARAHDGILAIGPRLALEAERVAEVESDDGRARELQQEVAQRADGDGMRNVSAFGFGGLGVARIHFGARCRFQSIEQVVGLHSQSLAPAHFHVRLARLLFRERVSHLRGATRRKRHHVIRKMDRTRGLFLKTQRAQPGHNDVLQIRLPRIDDVVHDRRHARTPARPVRRHRPRWPTTCGRLDSGKIADIENRGPAGRTSRVW